MHRYLKPICRPTHNLAKKANHSTKRWRAAKVHDR